MAMALDPVMLAQDLIRCPSVTPAEGGALDHLQSVLSDLGFTCHRLLFSDTDTPDVDNLYARIGDGAPHFVPDLVLCRLDLRMFHLAI